jgi:hypothetical protein
LGIKPVTFWLAAQCLNQLRHQQHAPFIHISCEIVWKATKQTRWRWVKSEGYNHTVCVSNSSPRLIHTKLNMTKSGHHVLRVLFKIIEGGGVHPCTGTEALYRPYGP